MAPTGICPDINRLDRVVALRVNSAARKHLPGRAATRLLAERLAGVEVALMVVLMVGGRRATVARMLASVGLVYATSEVVGSLWPRQRPFVRLAGQIEPLVKHAGGRSFPSRHVASGVAMASIGYTSQPVLGATMAGLALVLGLSRIAAGLHYPSDVAAGVALGAGVGHLLRE